MSALRCLCTLFIVGIVLLPRSAHGAPPPPPLTTTEQEFLRGLLPQNQAGHAFAADKLTITSVRGIPAHDFLFENAARVHAALAIPHLSARLRAAILNIPTGFRVGEILPYAVVALDSRQCMQASNLPRSTFALFDNRRQHVLWSFSVKKPFGYDGVNVCWFGPRTVSAFPYYGSWVLTLDEEGWSMCCPAKTYQVKNTVEFINTLDGVVNEQTHLEVNFAMWGDGSWKMTQTFRTKLIKQG